MPEIRISKYSTFKSCNMLLMLVYVKNGIVSGLSPKCLWPTNKNSHRFQMFLNTKCIHFCLLHTNGKLYSYNIQASLSSRKFHTIWTRKKRKAAAETTTMTKVEKRTAMDFESLFFIVVCMYFEQPFDTLVFELF